MGRAIGMSHEEEGEWILQYGERGEAVLSVTKHLLRGVARDGAGEVRAQTVEGLTIFIDFKLHIDMENIYLVHHHV